jgi:hypothetical protein
MTPIVRGLSSAGGGRPGRNPCRTRTLLASIHASFTEGFDTFDLKQAWALLDGLAA